MRHSSALSAFTITVIPSKATSSSVYSIPPSSQAVTSSSSIAREASAMSISPWQNSSKPSPVPGPSTEISTSGFVSLNSCGHERGDGLHRGRARDRDRSGEARVDGTRSAGSSSSARRRHQRQTAAPTSIRAHRLPFTMLPLPVLESGSDPASG